jgi:hypothetical protein
MVKRMPMPRRSSRSTMASDPADRARSEDRPAHLVDPIHPVGGQVQRFETEPLHQALEPEAESKNRSYAVMMVQAQHDRADDVVHARAEPAASDNAARQGRRVEEEPLPGACAFHRRRLLTRPPQPPQIAQRRGIQDAIPIVDESHPGHRRDDAAVADARDRKVEVAVLAPPVPAHGFTRPFRPTADRSPRASPDPPSPARPVRGRSAGRTPSCRRRCRRP